MPYARIFIFSIFLSFNLHAETREYKLEINHQEIFVEGQDKPMMGMTVNGQYPAPVLDFTVGEQAVIHVKNNTDRDTSIHWHGLLVPADQDGVPYLSNFPIKPGESFTYEFPIKHSGTYWYHSHTDLQEQIGVHGGIVVKDEKTPAFQHEAVLILQDWTHENPKKILANLKRDGDYYALKKDSVVSIAGYLENKALRNWWDARWMRMGGMDLSDVGYDAFLINGKQQQILFPEAKAGDEVLLRVVNSGASSYFFLHASPELEMKVIAADGNPVQAVVVKEILHALAETYDIVLKLPENKQYELRASAQDGTGYASVLIGSGEQVLAIDRTRPNLYMAHNMHEGHDMSTMEMPKENAETEIETETETETEMTMEMDHSMHAMHDMSEMEDDNESENKNQNENQMSHKNHDSAVQPDASSSYQWLKSLTPSVLPEGELKEMELRLTGSMENYIWTFDDIPMSKADKIRIKKGEVLRIKFINETMMDHPLHLHGHFFRVLSGNGDHDPLKHTVNVGPMQTVSIEFFANEEKDWFFHCHNLYHAKTGMARVFSYEEKDDERMMQMMAAKKRSKDMKDSDYFFKGDVKALDDYASLSLGLSNFDHVFMLEAENFNEDDKNFDGIEKYEASYQYRLTRWLMPTLIGEKVEDESVSKIGFTYVLPLLIDVGVFYNSEDEVEWDIETEFQLTKRIQSHLEYSSEDERHYGLEYRFNEMLSLEAAYINDVRYTAGVHFRF